MGLSAGVDSGAGDGGTSCWEGSSVGGARRKSGGRGWDLGGGYAAKVMWGVGVWGVLSGILHSVRVEVLRGRGDSWAFCRGCYSDSGFEIGADV